jgi:hypothetical protein
MSEHWSIRSATEALIGMQHDCEAMMKLTKEERDSLLFSVAAYLRDAEKCGMLRAAKIAGAAQMQSKPKDAAGAILAALSGEETKDDQ